MTHLRPTNLNTFFAEYRLLKVFAVFVLLGCCAYFQVLQYPFVHDDAIFIQSNPEIADLSHPLSVFLKPFLLGQQFVLSNAYYRPLLELFTRVQYRLFGLDPFGYHLTNIVLHIVNSFFIFLIFFKLGKKFNISLCVSLFFLLHPVQSQAVASIAGVSNLLFAFFCLVSLYSYIISSEKDQKRFYFLSLMLFLAGLFTKEQAVAFAGIILLYEVFGFGGFYRNFKLKWIKVFGFFVVLAAFMVFRSYITGGLAGTLLEYRGELMLRLNAIPHTILMYLRILFYPNDLHYYRTTDILKISDSSFLMLGIVIGLVVTSIQFLIKEQKRMAYFALMWFGLTLFPVLNIFPVIIEYSTISTAEHFLYLPMAGIFVWVVLLAEKVLGSFEGLKVRLAFIYMAAACIVMMGMTQKQNRIWRGDVPLFERTVKYEPDVARAQILLGKAYYFNRQFDESITAYRKALVGMNAYAVRINDKTARLFYQGFIKGIHFDLASAYQTKGILKESLNHFNSAARIDPHDAQLQNSLGVVHMQMGQIDDAVIHFDRAIKGDPLNIMAMNNLAGCYLHKGQKAQAQELLEKILMIDPNFQSAKANLKQLLLSK